MATAGPVMPARGDSAVDMPVQVHVATASALRPRLPGIVGVVSGCRSFDHTTTFEL